MLHKVKAINYIQVCADRLAAVTAKQHQETTEPVIPGFSDSKAYTTAVK